MAMTVDMYVLSRVQAINPEAAAVVRWAIWLEGQLHRIEEYPRPGDIDIHVRDIARAAITKTFDVKQEE